MNGLPIVFDRDLLALRRQRALAAPSDFLLAHVAADLVGRLRREPGGIAAMPLDRWEDHRHALGEYWMHTQDVARPQGVPQPPVDDALAEALWLRVQRASAALHRRTPGLTLVHPDGRRVTVTRGAPTLVVTGPPTELMCWAYGRPAEVRVERPGS